MVARDWLGVVARLGAAYGASLVAMLIASDIGGDLAVTASLWLVLAFVTFAVGRTVALARPFDPPRRQPGAVLASTPAALVVAGAGLALVGVEVGLGLLWIGLLVAAVVIAWATSGHGTSAAIAAAGLGWWVVCGGVVAWACVSSLLDPSRAADGGGFADSGNALAVYLGLFAFAVLTALTAGLQCVVLLIGRARD